MKNCRICYDEITGPAHLICPACAAALDDYTAKKTGVQAEIRAQVIEALKIALDDLQEWHKAFTWRSPDGKKSICEDCVTCREVIPAVRAALERLEEKGE